MGLGRHPLIGREIVSAFLKKMGMRLCRVAFCHFLDLAHVLIAPILAVWSAYHLISRPLLEMPLGSIIPRVSNATHLLLTSRLEFRIVVQ